MYLSEEIKKKKKRRGRGEGTIYQRAEDKLWVGQAVVSYDPISGKPKRKAVYGKTRSDVVKKLAKVSVLVNEGKFTDSNQTVAQWLDEWLGDHMKNVLRHKTYESYQMFIRIHIKPQIGKIKLKDLTTKRIQKFYNNKYEKGRIDGKGGLSPSSVERIHSILFLSLEQAEAERKIPYNPAKATTLKPRNQKEVRSLSCDEQDIFENSLKKERLQVSFLLGLYGGLRRGENLGVEWPDFNFDECSVNVQRNLLRIKDKVTDESRLSLEPLKSKKSYRVVPLPQEFMEQLKKHKARQAAEKLKAGPMYQDQNLVFCTSIGTPIEPRNYNRIFSRIIKKACIENFNLHGLRHTYVTRMQEIGIDPKIRQELMGHEKSATTDDYTHIFWEMKKLAANKLNDYIMTRKNPSKKEG